MYDITCLCNWGYGSYPVLEVNLLLAASNFELPGRSILNASR
jgi:hypothetical protein